MEKTKKLVKEYKFDPAVTSYDRTLEDDLDYLPSLKLS